jgi:glycosyltransferase involved in cell wall biosynthesis
MTQEFGILKDQVEFLGLVADPIPLYQTADIFVLTSDWEGTPNVVMEAMACGLVVVATRVGGVPELIEDGETGFLIEPGDLENLVKVLVELIEHPDLRASMGAAARQHIVENYDLTTLPRTIANFYKTL